MELSFRNWETAKRLEDLDMQRRKLGEPYRPCNHDWEDLQNTFIISGYIAYRQCRKCGMYLYKKGK